jgi:hypothetical protein
MASLLPSVTTFKWRHQNNDQWIGLSDRAPWLSGQISSYYAVRISPPLYFEARAKMPVGIGRPFPAIWMITGGPPNNPGKQNYEIDVHEGFGDSNQLHSTIHVDQQTKFIPVVNKPSGVELSQDFNTWGCHVTKERQIFFFNGVEVGRVETPPDANANQPYMLIFDVSAGIPWRGGGPPSGGPHDMVVRSVRLYAPDTRGLTLKQ